MMVHARKRDVLLNEAQLTQIVYVRERLNPNKFSLKFIFAFNFSSSSSSLNDKQT